MLTWPVNVVTICYKDCTVVDGVETMFIKVLMFVSSDASWDAVLLIKKRARGR